MAQSLGLWVTMSVGWQLMAKRCCICTCSQLHCMATRPTSCTTTSQCILVRTCNRRRLSLIQAPAWRPSLVKSSVTMEESVASTLIHCTRPDSPTLSVCTTAPSRIVGVRRMTAVGSIKATRKGPDMRALSQRTSYTLGKIIALELTSLSTRSTACTQRPSTSTVSRQMEF